MIININDIGEDGLEIRTTKKPEWVINIPEFSESSDILNLNSDIILDINVQKIAKEVLVRGDIAFEINALCSRCIDSVSKKLLAKINLLLSPKEDVEDTEKDIDHEVYEDEVIDISDYLREQIALTLPVSILCKNDCKGLCSTCGTNLNNNVCDCKKEWVDPRFAVLKELKL